MIRTLARPLLASAFAIDGVQMLLNSNDYKENAKKTTGALKKVLPAAALAKIPQDPETQARLVGTTKVIASGALATGKAPRVAAATLAALQIPALLNRHAFWNETGAVEKEAARRGFITDLALLGGLSLATADTAGKPSLAWRVQKALPGKTDQQKMIDNAKAHTNAFAASANEQAQGFFDKAKEVAVQVSDNVSDYVEDNSDSWKATANNFAADARDIASDATAQAQTAAQKLGKKARKQAKKAQKAAQRQAKKLK